MSQKNQVDPEVLFATAKVQATLDLVPRLIGDRNIWAPWLRDHLYDELISVGDPDSCHPHSILLGSLERVLYDHLTSGSEPGTLDFQSMRSDDPKVTDSCYVDIPRDTLPKLEGTDFLWHDLPASVSVKNLYPGPVRSFVDSEELEEISPTDTCPSQAAASSEKGKKRATSADLTKDNKRKKVHLIVSREDSTSSESGMPMRKPDEGTERNSHHDHGNIGPSRVCDSCKQTGFACKWPDTNPTGPKNQKQACHRCRVQKLKCQIQDVWFIRNERGKAAQTKDSRVQVKENEFREVVDGLLYRVEAMESAYKEERESVLKRIATLELQVKRMKRG
ncbi:hypothetical protein JVU11DRAFT_10878 [Chiua virens]|nr:hypothetical protein JVU11DRAFT_10878 [Chiua virens]